MLVRIAILVAGLVLFEMNRRYARRFPTASFGRPARTMMRASLGGGLFAIAWFTFHVISSFSDVSAAPVEQKARVMEEGIRTAVVLPGVIVLSAIAAQLVLFIIWRKHATQAPPEAA